MRILVMSLVVAACTSKHETSETKVELKVVPAAGSAQGKATAGSPEPTAEAACSTGDQDACAAIADDKDRKPAEVSAVLGRLCDKGSLPACTSLGAVKIDRDHDVAGAVALFTKACDGGNGASCGNLGIVHHEGLGGTKDLAKALELFQKGCEHGSGKSCGNAGRMLGDGEGVTQDVPAATTLLRKGCQQHDDESCRMLLNAAKLLVASDHPPAANVTLAISSFEQLCDGENGGACAEAGWLIEQSTGGKDPAFAKMYERGCTLDDGAACYHHGRVAHDAAAFERGCRLHDARACEEAVKALTGEPATKAFPLLEEACRLDDKPLCVTACKAGDAYGCELLAGQYKLGARFGKDDALAKRGNQRAVELREKGCKANDAKSCFDLGFAYHQGEVVKKDHAKARGLYDKACKLGALDACYGIAEREIKGLDDQPKDVAAGVAIYEDICKRGYKTACGSIGWLHVSGEGVAKDEAKAVERFAEGCAEECAWCCYEAGQRTLDKDRDAGIAKLKSGCRWGDGRGCEALEKMGISERKDPAHTTVFR